MEPFSLLARAGFDLVRDGVQRARRVRVRTHGAVFAGSNDLCVFVNVVNVGQRPITLTHVWFATEPPVHVVNEERRLPRALGPDEPWETWVPLRAFAAQLEALSEERLLRSARVRLSTGRVLKARPNRDVPPIGAVPGG
jgi:hypothetical protein